MTKMKSTETGTLFRVLLLISSSSPMLFEICMRISFDDCTMYVQCTYHVVRSTINSIKLCQKVLILCTDLTGGHYKAAVTRVSDKVRCCTVVGLIKFKQREIFVVGKQRSVGPISHILLSIQQLLRRHCARSCNALNSVCVRSAEAPGRCLSNHCALPGQ